MSGFNCSEVRQLGCACEGCCADGASTAAPLVETACEGCISDGATAAAALVEAESASHPRQLEECSCLIPQSSFDLTLDLSSLLHQDGGLIALVAPVCRGPVDWLTGLATDALRDATGLSRVDNAIQGRMKQLIELLAWTLLLLCCRCKAEEAQSESLARGDPVSSVTL